MSCVQFTQLFYRFVVWKHVDNFVYRWLAVLELVTRKELSDGCVYVRTSLHNTKL